MAGAHSRPGEGDPASSDRLYDAEELEWLRAVDAFKARTGRQFPRATDYLAIARGLGYRRVGSVELRRVEPGRGRVVVDVALVGPDGGRSDLGRRSLAPGQAEEVGLAG